MAARAAQAKDFARLPDHDRVRFQRLLEFLQVNSLSCRCEMVDGQEFSVTVGKGYARAGFWLENFGLT